MTWQFFWPEEGFLPLIGGALIGLSALLLLVGIGRIAGISGILKSALFDRKEYWQWVFLLLMIGAAGVAYWITPNYPLREGFSLWLLATAGFLVGFGARYGSGCTSGHGVCGIARLSKRSIVATLIFIATAMLVQTLFIQGAYL